jgi:hypothetical protein
MRAIQSYLPDPMHYEIHRIFVKAKPDEAWQAARHFDGSKIPWVRFIFDLRDIPDLIRGRKPDKDDRRLGVDQVADSGKGFIILEERPGRDVVVGSVGQFWHLNIPFANLKPNDFEAFNEPGWGKLTWAISVDPFLDGSTISFELRTTATDKKSRKKLKRYFLMIGLFSNLIRYSVMTYLESELGKMKFPRDKKRVFPGNEIIPEAKIQITFHKNIESPTSIVWRYLMQLGCDRAGWYSIDFLDNGGKKSVDHLVEGWETRKLGDKLAGTPAKTSFYYVYSIEPENHFIVGGETVRLGGPFKMTWSFILEKNGEDAAHLISNARMISSPKWAEWIMGKVFYPPIHGFMSRAQLKNIKKLSERDAQARRELQTPRPMRYAEPLVNN